MPRPLRIQVEGAASYIHQEALAGIDLFKAEEDYAAYARLYRTCTISASEALTRLLVEAEKTARDIHSRYAE